MKEEIKRLQEIADFFKRMNRKVLLFKLVNQAKSEYDKYNYEKGRELLEEALNLEPENNVTLRGLGCIAQFQGDYENALKYFFLALEHSDSKEIEYTLIGMAYYLQDKLDDAVKYFNLAIDSNDSYDKAYEGRNQAMLENHLKVIDLQESLEHRYNGENF